MEQGGNLVLGFAVLLVMGAIYFIPGIVAITRGRDGASGIFLLNIFIGWTVIGWVVLLIIAFTGETEAQRFARRQELDLLRQIANQRNHAAGAHSENYRSSEGST